MPRKPSSERQSLSSESIVASAAKLIDREGSKILSSRRLAAELGCQAMSLYHHVGSMEKVMDLVVDHALRSVPLPEPDPRTAEKQLADLLRAYLKLASARPRTFLIVSSRRWSTPAAGVLQGRMFELLILSGLRPREALRGARILIMYLNGSGLAIAGWLMGTTELNLHPRSESIMKLQKVAATAPIAQDVEWGLRHLIRTLIA